MREIERVSPRRGYGDRDYRDEGVARSLFDLVLGAYDVIPADWSGMKIVVTVMIVIPQQR
jgi:hypothetical protein